MNQRRKLNLTLKRQFQRWLLLRITGVVVLSSILAAGILYLYAHTEVVGSFHEAHFKIRRVSDLLLPVVTAGSLVSLVSGIILALFLPQKIAGPLYRIEKQVGGLAAGDLISGVKLRSGDPLQDTASQMTESIAALRAQIEKIKESHIALERSVATADQARIGACLLRQKEILHRLQT